MTDLAPDLDSTFRCIHWACTLAHKHCLRRQAEVHRKPGRGASGKHFVKERAAHPYCASGECEQGRSIAALFPDVKHHQHDPRSAPRLDIVRAVEERTMPRGKPTTKRTCCESSGTRHLATCPKHGKGIAIPMPKVTTRSKEERQTLVRVASHKLFDTQESTVEQLVETMEACRSELALRKDQVAQQLRSIEAAIGGSTASVVATLQAIGSMGTGA